jgi:DNA-binding LytR/AlgR family response regulator
MKLKCAIIEDDPVFCSILQHFVEGEELLDPIGIYHSADEALAELDHHRPDLLFLDVELPGMSGMELLGKLTFSPPVVIVSQRKEYGADAFEYECIDYLCKPVNVARFKKAVHKVRKYFEKQLSVKPGDSQRDSLFIRQDRMWVRLPVNDILYVRADNNDVIVKTRERTYKAHSKLRDIYEQLPKLDFLQVHRSYIVQLNKIDKVDGEVIEVNARTIPVSKTYLKEMYKRLNISAGLL